MSRRTLAAGLLILGAVPVVYLGWGRSTDRPDPSPSNAWDAKGRGVGSGPNACRSTPVEGLKLVEDGSASRAWTVIQAAPDGGCNWSWATSYLVKVDVDGDGRSDAATRSQGYCVYCRAVAATDMDRDGDGELLVLEQGGSVSSYSMYAIRGTRAHMSIDAIAVAAPGHPEARHRAGKPFRFWVGGDEGFSGAATCSEHAGDRLLVVTWSDHPIEGPGAETTEVHRTSFRLRGGALHVVEATDAEEPTDPYRPSGLKQSRDVCGVDLSRIR